MSERIVKDFMTKKTKTIDWGAAVSEAVSIMHENKYSCLVVCEEENPVGIISERDLVSMVDGLMSGAESAPQKVSDLMSFPLISIQDTASIEEANQLLHAENIRRLVVLDEENNFVGLLTQTDVLKGFL